MADKIKIVINKKNPSRIVSFFGNIQNKVGTYDRERIECLKMKFLEKGIEFGRQIVFAVEKMDDIATAVTDEFFDKIIDGYEKLKKDSVKEVENVSDIVDVSQIQKVEKTISIPEIIPTRSINFEDLEPLGHIIDEEDDIYELQELKMELLFNELKDESSKENGNVRKK